MNKTKLFLMAAAPAALVMPIDAFAAEVEKVTVTAIGNVGSELKVEISDFPVGADLKYQWYYVAGDKETAIDGATDPTFKVPAEAFGKTIMLKVTNKSTDPETIYTSNAVIITPKLEAGLLLTDKQLVNTKVTANIAVLNKGTVIAGKGYQWYYVDSTSKTAISGATNRDFTLPPDAAGKQITVEVKTTDGLVYTSAPMPVEELSLIVPKPEFKETLVLPGAVVKAPEITVKDQNNAILQPSQISYNYQWYYKEGENFSIIDGATSASYTIPDISDDDLSKSKITIVMKVTAKVGAKQAPSDYSNEIEVSKEPVTNLIAEIAKLVDATGKVTYKSLTFVSFESFATNVEDLRKKYDAFPSAEKSKVTNYDILQKALADVAITKSFIDKMNAIEKATDKLAYAKGLLVDYEKFDYLQRSLVEDLSKILDEIKKNPDQGDVLSSIIELNAKIIKIIKEDQTSYNMEWGSETGDRTLSEFRSEIESVQAHIRTLPSDYQSFVQNQHLLTTALIDVKKVEALEKKVQTIKSAQSKSLDFGITKADKSLIKQANTVLASYNKLTYLQQSLMSVDELLAILNKEKEKAEGLEDEINKLQLTINYTYDIKIESDEDLQAKLTEVTNILAAYKTFSKEAATKITGIDGMKRLQKDLKAAQKVSKLIDTYNKLKEDTNSKDSKLASSYKSAKTAYDKLTTGQQTFVYNFKDFAAPTDSGNNTVIKNPEDKVNADVVVGKIDIIPTENVGDFGSYKGLVSDASTAYKGLNSGARKYVTNYVLLQGAEKNVKGAEAFLKKVDAAKAEADKGKQYKKIQTVTTAYLKLPANQQTLVRVNYDDLLKLLENTADYTNLSDLIEDIFAIIDENTGSYATIENTPPIENIKKVENEYNALSSAEKKQITNYYILKQALADVKKVEAFMKKYESMSEKTKAAVLKDFKALTAKQLSLVSEPAREMLIKEEKEQYNANADALKLVEDINNLLVDGVYVDGLDKKVEELRRTYDEDLSAMQKAIVKNYSKLTQAESDLQKVAEVRALEGNPEAWQKSFNKLSKKLELLYDQIPTP